MSDKLLFNQNVLNDTIQDMDGENFKQPGKETTNLTYRYALRLSLTAVVPPQQGQPEEDKFQLYELALRIHSQPSTEALALSSEEISLIKKKAAVVWPVEVYGHLVTYLNSPIVPA